MKKLLIALTFLFSLNIVSQTGIAPPQGINYQSIIRNSGGTPLVSTTVTVEFKLYEGLSGPMVYDEIHPASTTSTTALGMVNLTIGNGISVGPLLFSNINWSKEIAYEVFVNSVIIGTKTLFKSVPYALYSPIQKLKLDSVTHVLSSGPTSNSITLSGGTTYYAGTDIAIGAGNIINNTASDKTVSIIPGNSNINITSAYPNFTVSSTPLLTISGTNLSISNGNTVTLPAGTTLTSAVAPNNNLNISSSGTTYTIGVPSYTLQNPAGTNSLVINNGINTSSINLPSPTLSLNSGTLSVGSNTINLLDANNGFWGLKGNAVATNTAAFIGTTDATTLVFKTNGTERIKITPLGNIGVNVLNPTHKVHIINNSNVYAGLYAENSFATTTLTAHGVYGKSTNSHTLAAGVYGENTGNGPAIYGFKVGTTSIGNAGKFEINNTGNGADALYAKTNGTGAAIHAVSAPSSPLALILEDGHIKSTQATAPSYTAVALSGGFMGSPTFTPNNCTDVKGSLLAVCTTTGLINSLGTITIRVTYNKSYINSPAVVITPTSDFGKMSYYISNSATGYFDLKLINNSGSNISGSTFTFSFNYMVIE